VLQVKKILFPVDFSENFRPVAEHVRSLALKLGAEVKVVYVVHELVEFSGLIVRAETLANLEAEIAKGAEEKIDLFAAEFLSGISCATEVRIGDVVSEILAVADEADADLIVMGTHGRKGMDRMVFGSVAGGVVKRASVPVITVKPCGVKGS
jgi:nucleotide-binding universal stress UspA family protein